MVHYIINHLSVYSSPLSILSIKEVQIFFEGLIKGNERLRNQDRGFWFIELSEKNKKKKT